MRDEIEPQGSTVDVEHAAAVSRAGAIAAAWRFVHRISELDATDIGDAGHLWHAVMRGDSDAWFAAERAAGNAVVDSGRSTEQARLLEAIADVVLHGVWYRNAHARVAAAPERRSGVSEASGQYLTSVAMLAVLAGDQLTPIQFELLYRPFALLVPVRELAQD